jgi:PTH2 family peptidyl-tRNA hydrolase
MEPDGFRIFPSLSEPLELLTAFDETIRMDYKQAIVVRNDLGMTKGKIAAQASHASLEAYEKAKVREPQWAQSWRSAGMAKIVLKVQSEKELLELFEAAKRTLPAALIIDAGHTQTEPGTRTGIAIGPAPVDAIDAFTKNLKLL